MKSFITRVARPIATTTCWARPTSTLSTLKPLKFTNHNNYQPYFRLQYKPFSTITSPNAGSTSDKEIIVTPLTGDDTGITVLTLNREKARNALGKQLMSELGDAIENLQNDTQTRAIIIESNVRNVFCAGADLKEREKMTAEEGGEFVKLLRKTFTDIENLPQAVIACIDGAAFGGGLELALACDLRVAGPNAKFGLIETSLAIIPGAGGTQRLPRTIPVPLAKELIYTAKKFGSEDAYKYGLLNRMNTNENETSYSVALQLAREIIPNGPIALRMAKNAINKGMQQSNLSDAMLVEQECYAGVLQTEDRWEAMAAFREKRKPVFKGK